MTPHSVPCGQADTMYVTRQAALDAAFISHPNRCKGKTPRPHAVPDAGWIHPPLKDKITTQQTQIYSVNS
jgi:putative transposase